MGGHCRVFGVCSSLAVYQRMDKGPAAMATRRGLIRCLRKGTHQARQDQPGRRTAVVIVPQKPVDLRIGLSRKNMALAGEAIPIFSMGGFTIYNFVTEIKLEDKLLWGLQGKIRRQEQPRVWVQIGDGDAKRFLLTGINATHVRLMEDRVARDGES